MGGLNLKWYEGSGWLKKCRGIRPDETIFLNINLDYESVKNNCLGYMVRVRRVHQMGGKI